MKKLLRINFWSSPRNISTAIMYSFAQRSDMTVVDEPLYAHYLTKTHKPHPGFAEILKSQEHDGEKVVKKVLFGQYPTPAVLFKQMTHHLIKLDLGFLDKMTNVLLIRSPYEIIRSYSKVITHPVAEDVGIKQQVDLYSILAQKGTPPTIVDSRLLLLSPRSILNQLCECLEIPFEENMLFWPKGVRPEDGVWAKYWYKNVHNSTGFQPYQAKTEVLPKHLQELVEECQPHYDQLFQFALKP